MVLLIITKLFFLQIKNGQYYEALALGQQISFEEVDGERGKIFFSNGEILAETKKKILAYITPDKIEDQERVVEIFGEDIIPLLEEGQVFKKEIVEDSITDLREVKGISIDRIMTRSYPQKETASHVIGFTNEEGQGQYGIEGYFNDELKGETGLFSKTKSPFGFLTSFFKEDNDSEKGIDIYLTLDQNIQYFSEKLLKEAKEKWDFKRAQIIVMDPKTGQIIALANYPCFDSNDFSKESFDVFINASIQELFEPGSIFKPITMAAGLEEGLVEPETEYIDKGVIEVGGPPIYNFEKRVWGKQTMTDVLEESINTGVVFVQDKLGADKFLEYLERFGFFEKTGIELQGEVSSQNDNLKQGYKRDIAVASFGQGIEMTSLQFLKAFSAISNGGMLIKPFIVDKIVSLKGEKITEIKEIRRVLSERTSSKITAMLVSVIRNGAGRRAQIPGYYIAGKTGTAQVPLKSGGYSEYETIQSFIGYFPALDPKALILVRLDDPKGVIAASYSAVPIFKDLTKHIIDLWQIPPSY